MKNPITTEGAASAQNPLPPVPTTKILAISHFVGTPMTPAQRAQIMPHEVHDTVNAYLAGKIDQWYFRTDGKLWFSSSTQAHRKRRKTFWRNSRWGRPV